MTTNRIEDLILAHRKYSVDILGFFQCFDRRGDNLYYTFGYILRYYHKYPKIVLSVKGISVFQYIKQV